MSLRRGEGYWLSLAAFVEALFNNGIGNHRAALGPAVSAEGHPDLTLSTWAAIELVEAAVRSGATGTATAALARLTERTSACGTDWALGVEARSRALLSDGAEAERLYREAIERLGRTCVRTQPCPCPPRLWGMAAPGAPPHRRTHPVAHRARHVRCDGNARVRRADPARACGHRRDRPQAHHHRHRAAADTPGSTRSPGWPPKA